MFSASACGYIRSCGLFSSGFHCLAALELFSLSTLSVTPLPPLTSTLSPASASASASISTSSSAAPCPSQPPSRILASLLPNSSFSLFPLGSHPMARPTTPLALLCSTSPSPNNNNSLLFPYPYLRLCLQVLLTWTQGALKYLPIMGPGLLTFAVIYKVGKCGAAAPWVLS